MFQICRRWFVIATVALCPLASGCGGQKSFGQYTTAELEAELAKRLECQEVHLTDKGNGRFTGTGKKATGEVLELEVTRSDRGLTWEQTQKDAEGKVLFHGKGGAFK
jgi:hypothetical protein